MSEEVLALKKEIEKLNKRLKSVGQEKANLQMAVQMIQQVANVTGLVNVVDYILNILVGAIGGSNISIYYESEGRWKYTDILGEKKWLNEIDDPLVKKSIETKKFIKKKESEPSALFITGHPRTNETWVYPLQVHGSYFGAARLQGMAFEHAHYRENIDPFIQYSALVLYHEVSSIKKLTTAYQKVNAAKKALEKSQEQFELAMKFANEGLFDWDLKTNQVYYSPVWKSLLGYADDEIKNVFSEWERLCKPEDVKASKEILTEVLDGKRDRFEKEFKMLHKDGHWVDILSKANIIFNENGEGQRLVGTHVDISNIKRMENNLLESEVKYRSIMEATKDLTYICSKDYRIEFMNPAMVEWLGADQTGEVCHQAIHGLAHKCTWCSFDQVIDQNSISKEFISPRDNKKYLSSNSPIIHVDGSVSKLIFYHDVTDFIEMEKRLQQSQRMESIGTLAGGIAHDFNNILFPIVGHTEMLLEDIPEDSPFRDRLDQIYTSAMRASKLVKQILTFFRQKNGELKLMKMQPIIKEALKLIRSTIPTTIEIKQNIQAECGAIKADPTQIHQIVMNLATNAYHAMEEIGGELKVGLKQIELGTLDLINPDMTPGQYACLTVVDTGMGMDKKLTQKIFDPFFTTKTIGKGTGMGLSVVHGIVAGMGGAVRVYSKPGKGTEFYVYFPVEKSSFEKQSVQTHETIQYGTETILLVDDEDAIITMEKRMLERLGYQVTSRTSSIEALEAFRGSPDKFDLVITDMAMPNMPGDKLLVEFVKLRADIPILLCTGFSETMSEEKAASLGIKGFLLKPIVMKDLAQKIREVLDNTAHPKL